MTLGADKAYDTRDFVSILRQMNVRPHVARNVRRSGGSAIDRRTTRHAGYTISQRKRPLIEKAFGWMKQTGGMRKKVARAVESELAIPDDGSGVQPLETAEAECCSVSRTTRHHMIEGAVDEALPRLSPRHAESFGANEPRQQTCRQEWQLYLAASSTSS